MTWNIFSKSFELTLNKSHDHVEISFRYFLPHHSSFFPLPPTTDPFHQTSKPPTTTATTASTTRITTTGDGKPGCFTYIFFF
jgi:hypothetical protein